LRYELYGTTVATSGLEAGHPSRFETGGGHADRWHRFIGNPRRDGDTSHPW
jgi:hypothetical protein